MSTQNGATAAVTEFVPTVAIERLPAEVVYIAKRCIIDGLGVILAGSTAEGSRILRDYVRTGAAAEESTVFGADQFRTSAAAAALLNGASGHAMDFDDTQLSSSPDRLFGLLTHPTIPPLAAALALGERRAASGAAVLEAFVAGFEVECKIAEAIDPNHYIKGFHSSGTIGTFGATIAAAKMLKLDRTALGHALGIAASMAAGIRVNFGTMTKPLHVGRAAQNGVTAAELAAKGFTGRRRCAGRPVGFLSDPSAAGSMPAVLSACSAARSPSSTPACRSSPIRAAALDIPRWMRC